MVRPLRAHKPTFFNIRKVGYNGDLYLAMQWSEFLATDPENLSSIPGATRFSEK
jgi:hypothetical protein